MSQNRRDFLKGAGAALTPMILPQAARGANDQVVFGLIGAGGRGRGVTANFKEAGAVCAAVCDIYEPNLELGLTAASEGAAVYTDYSELLQRKDLDAVLIASPDHQHAPMLFEALKAGKDVYLEKPMSHSIEQGVQMIKAVRATKQIVQIGMQRRSSPSVLACKRMVDEGLLGNIYLARVQWFWNISKPLNNTPLPGKVDWEKFLGPAPKHELEPMRFRSWRYFWDYSGGNMTDQGTHLMDVVQWFTNAGTPRAAVCQGFVYGMIGAETPDCFNATFDYGKMMATWTLNYNNAYQNGWTIYLQGNKGTMMLDNDGFKIYQEPWDKNPEPIYEFKGSLSTQAHVNNFLECVKTRKEPNAPVEVGHTAVCGPHLANVAYHKKREARLNAEATKVS
ncbi:MAG: Gfo/Idh/MocA family oxidoreductase [Acidobacteria bacterium]|nr:Gfo/Idh/MocA family oxidoreductase [Acidobacteriota bacterium]